MSKSRTSGRSPFGRRADRTGSVEVFVRPERSVLVRLVAVLWQLRTELTASGGGRLGLAVVDRPDAGLGRDRGPGADDGVA